MKPVLLLVCCEFGLGACLERLGLVGLLPGKGIAGAAEVTVGGGCLEDRPAQVEAFDDAFGGQLEVLADEFDEARLGDLAGAEGVDANGDRLGDADGVGELDFGLIGEACGATMFLAM